MPLEMHFHMKNNWSKFLIFLLTLAIFNSCNWDDEETEFSSNPDFVSLRFGRNDSVPAQQSAVFTLEFDSLLMDSVIVNLDSLPFLTRLDTVYPTFVFRSTAATQLIMTDTLGTGLDTIVLTGKDTVNFNRVLRVRNIAANLKAERTYPIKVNVHQVEPDLYVWRRITDQIYTHSGSVQKVVAFKGTYYFYASSGVNNYLYTSTDAVNWTAAVVSGMPSNPVLRNMLVLGDKIILSHEDGKVYSSADGMSWSVLTSLPAGFDAMSLLFVLEGNAWSVVRNQITKQWNFATSADGASWSVREAIPDNFPVGDFAALSFKSRTNKPKALVLGGYSAAGELLARTWSVERNVFQEYKWVDFGLENTTLVSLSGASVVAYDNRLLLFGGMDIEDNVIDTPFMESIDEGLSWRQVDETLNQIFDVQRELLYQPRSYQTAIVDEPNQRIYLFGGRSRTPVFMNVFTDVWTGKVNRAYFLRK